MRRSSTAGDTSSSCLAAIYCRYRVGSHNQNKCTQKCIQCTLYHSGMRLQEQHIIKPEQHQPEPPLTPAKPVPGIIAAS
jgi:hypothetical protein